MIESIYEYIIGKLRIYILIYALSPFAKSIMLIINLASNYEDELRKTKHSIRYTLCYFLEWKYIQQIVPIIPKYNNSQPFLIQNPILKHRCDGDASRVLGADANGRLDRHLLLLPDRGLRLWLLVLAAFARCSISRSARTASAAESPDGDVGIAGLQQQVHQSRAERAAEEPQRQERQLVGGEQAHAKGQEDLHLIQKATGRLRLAPRIGSGG